MSRLPENQQIPPMPDLLPPEAEDGPGGITATLNNPQLINPQIQAFPGIVLPKFRNLRAGCWLLNYKPSGSAQVT